MNTVYTALPDWLKHRRVDALSGVLQQRSLAASTLFDPCRMPSEPGLEQALSCSATSQQCMNGKVSAGGRQKRHGCSAEEAL